MFTHAILAAIVAMSENRVIGANNQLPWHLPADLKHFKQLTLHHPIIMGRKTYESIGKALPLRENIVLTRDQNFKAPECHVVSSLDSAIEQASSNHPSEIFIIGGAEIYRQAFAQLNKLYVTFIHHTCEGDTFFPEINESEWQESEREDHQADDKNAYPFSFVTYERI